MLYAKRRRRELVAGKVGEQDLLYPDDFYPSYQFIRPRGICERCCNTPGASTRLRPVIPAPSLRALYGNGNPYGSSCECTPYFDVPPPNPPGIVVPRILPEILANIYTDEFANALLDPNFAVPDAAEKKEKLSLTVKKDIAKALCFPSITSKLVRGDAVPLPVPSSQLYQPKPSLFFHAKPSAFNKLELDHAFTRMTLVPYTYHSLQGEIVQGGAKKKEKCKHREMECSSTSSNSYSTSSYSSESFYSSPACSSSRAYNMDSSNSSSFGREEQGKREDKANRAKKVKKDNYRAMEKRRRGIDNEMQKRIREDIERERQLREEQEEYLRKFQEDSRRDRKKFLKEEALRAQGEITADNYSKSGGSDSLSSWTPNPPKNSTRVLYEPADWKFPPPQYTAGTYPPVRQKRANSFDIKAALNLPPDSKDSQSSPYEGDWPSPSIRPFLFPRRQKYGRSKMKSSAFLMPPPSGRSSSALPVSSSSLPPRYHIAPTSFIKDILPHKQPSFSPFQTHLPTASLAPPSLLDPNPPFGDFLPPPSPSSSTILEPLEEYDPSFFHPIRTLPDPFETDSSIDLSPFSPPHSPTTKQYTSSYYPLSTLMNNASLPTKKNSSFFRMSAIPFTMENNDEEEEEIDEEKDKRSKKKRNSAHSPPLRSPTPTQIRSSKNRSHSINSIYPPTYFTPLQVVPNTVPYTFYPSATNVGIIPGVHEPPPGRPMIPDPLQYPFPPPGSSYWKKKRKEETKRKKSDEKEEEEANNSRSSRKKSRA